MSVTNYASGRNRIESERVALFQLHAQNTQVTPTKAHADRLEVVKRTVFAQAACSGKGKMTNLLVINSTHILATVPNRRQNSRIATPTFHLTSVYLHFQRLDNSTVLQSPREKCRHRTMDYHLRSRADFSVSRLCCPSGKDCYYDKHGSVKAETKGN